MNRLKKLLKKEKAVKIIVAVGFIGICLIFLSTVFDTDGKKNTVVAEQSSDDYAKGVEKQLNGIVCKITGEKAVEVMVSLESSGETIYADAKNISTNNLTDSGENEKLKTEQKDNTEQKYIIIENSDGDQQALIVSKLSPTVRGVVIVTKYADNASVCERITSAVTTVLNVPAKKVCVVAAN